MRITGLIRKLAKSNYYQSLFSYSKENGVKLFKNDMELTEIQIMFLRYLSFYSSIFMDLALGDIDNRVLENDIYEDAYVMYRNKNMTNKEKKEDSTEKPKGNIQWVFKNKPTGKSN